MAGSLKQRNIHQTPTMETSGTQADGDGSAGTITNDRLINSIDNELDRQHAALLLKQIFVDKKKWEEYVQNRENAAGLGMLKSREDCIRRLKACSCVDEKLELLLKELKPLSVEATRLGRIAKSQDEDAQCFLKAIRLNCQVLGELVAGDLECGSINPDKEQLLNDWLEKFVGRNVVTTEITVRRNDYGILNDMEVCDTCAWNMTFSDARWRCFVCREVQCTICHEHFHDSFHGRCSSKTKALGVVYEHFPPTTMLIEATACTKLSQSMYYILRAWGERPCFCPWETKEWVTYNHVLDAALRRATKLSKYHGVKQLFLCFPAGSMEFYLWDIACILTEVTTIGIHAPPPPKEDWPTCATHLVCHNEVLRKYRHAIPSELVWVDPALNQVDSSPLDFEGLQGRHVSDPSCALWTQYFTSGTTGKPKLIPETREQFRRGFFRPGRGRYTPHCTVSYLPHCWGADRSTVYWTLTHGGRVGFAPSNPSMPEIVEAMEVYEPTSMTFPPAVANFLLALGGEDDLKPPTNLGGRLEYASVGGGPVPQGMPLALSQKYGIEDVREGYGSTEVGGIASRGWFLPSVKSKVRLRDLQNPENWLDKQKEGVVGELWIGDHNTCDIVEVKNKGQQVRVIGRSSNAASFKLPNGKWCALIDIEDSITQACCPDLFDEVMVWCNGHGRLVLLGCILSRRPEAENDCGELLRKVTARTKLSPQMRPKGLLTTNKPLPKTITMKIQRGKVITEFQEAADCLNSECNETQSTAAPEAVDTTTVDILSIASQILGKQLDPAKSFFENGGDSMSAIQLLQQVKKQLGDAHASNWRSLLNELLQGQAPASELESECRTIAPPPVPDESALCVLLTGATGFFGRHVMNQLLMSEADTIIVCLVREASKEKIRETDRIRVVTEVPPVLKFRRIFHCAANVDHIKGYNALKADNVDLTESILRLRLAPMIYCSTTSTQSGKPPFASGYTQSKWVSEKMVLRSGGKCFWPPLLVWGNRRDWLTRLIHHCLRTGRYPSKLGFVVACPVEVAAQDMVAERPCSAWDLDLSELFARIRIETGIEPVSLSSFIAELQTDRESPAYPIVPLLSDGHMIGGQRSPSLDLFPINWSEVWPLLRSL